MSNYDVESSIFTADDGTKSDIESLERDEDCLPDTRPFDVVASDDYSRSLRTMRSASELLLKKQERGSYPRSQTWEGFLNSDNPNDRIYENNASEGSHHGGSNRLDGAQAGNCTSINPTDLSEADNSSNLKQISHERLAVCAKCCQKRLDILSSANDMKTSSTKGNLFNSVRTFVICLSLLQLVQVMGSGYSKSALTSVERRYRLSTFHVGILQSCFHIGNLSVILFVSYFGSKWHRPRAIAIGSLIMAVSSFLSATPQLVGSRYYVDPTENVGEGSRIISGSLYSRDTLDIIGMLNQTFQPSPLITGESLEGSMVSKSNPESKDFFSWMRESKTKLCVPATSKDDTDSEFYSETDAKEEYVVQEVANIRSPERLTEGEDVSEDADIWNDSNFYIFIAVGSVLKGMGHSPLHPLGMSFIDDYATPRNSAVYIGVVSALSLLGPAFGFILGSLTTGTWVDWGWVEQSEVKITPSHPLWVGAWWLGYLVTAFLLLMATIPFSLFPREITKEQDNESDETSCFGFFRRSCCNGRMRSENDLVQSEKDAFNCDANDIEAGAKVCPCKVTMTNGDVKLQNGDIKYSSYELSFSNGDKLPDAGNLKEQEALLGAEIEITDSFDETKATKLISYLERPGDTGVRTDATSCEMSFEMRLQSRSQSMTSQRDLVMKTSISGSGVACAERKLSTYSKSRRKSEGSRRPSRLEKLALFDFTTSLKGLLTDSVFLSITFGFVCLTSFLAASVTYVSKYMETQFSVTASLANLLNGSVNLPMAVVGNLLGGWLIRRFNLNVRHTMVVVVTGLAMTIVCVTALLLFKCNHGSNLNYSIGSEGGKCSSKCDCDDVYAPVCDITTSITYRSPCHAGCTEVTSWKKSKLYTGCRCIHGNHPSNDSTVYQSSLYGGILVRGACKRPDCSKSHLPVFLGVMGTASLTAGLASTPSSLVILRIVPPAEKAFAIGIVFVFTRILAWIPAPVYVGYVIDSACLRWSNIGGITKSDEVTEVAEDDGNHCEIYNKDTLRRNFFAATGGLLVLSLIFYILAFYLETRRSRRKRLKSSKRSRIISFDSPFISDKSPERTPTITSPLLNGNIPVTPEENNEKDTNFNDLLSPENEGFLLSSALQKPFKIAMSVSAPALATQSLETTFTIPPSNDKTSVIRATVV